MLRGLGNLNLLIFFVGIVAAAVFAGVPIAFSFGLATFGYLALTTTTPMVVVVGRMDEGMSHLILLAVPLFVFLGLLIEMTGMARAMVAFLASLLGHVRGGLSYVLVGAMYLVSGISGSKAADMAAIAPVLFPEMKERGARPGDLVALLSATGAQTETIPPSIVLITIGSVTGVSITALFTGGMLPGVVLAIALCLVVWWRYRKEDLSHVTQASWGEVGRLFLIAIPAIALPFIIRAAVIEGVATATEVSTIGIVYAVLAGLFIYRRFNWRRLGPMLVETASLSGAILLIIGAATGMAWALTQSGFSRDLAAVMGSLPGRSHRLPRRLDRRLHHPRQRAGGHSGDRAVRPAAVSDRPRDRRPRGPLLDGGHPRHGHGPVRPALRRRLLRRLRDQPDQSRRRHAADRRLHAGAADRPAGGGGGAVDFDRLPGMRSVEDSQVGGCRHDRAGRSSSNPLVGSDRVEGTAIYSVEGKHIGAVKRLMIEKVSGRVVYVVMTFSGFSDAASEIYTVPWGKLSYDAKLGGYRTAITENDLSGAPRFARTGEDDAPLSEAQEEELHAHFNIPPYWRAL